MRAALPWTDPRGADAAGDPSDLRSRGAVAVPGRAVARVRDRSRAARSDGSHREARSVRRNRAAPSPVTARPRRASTGSGAASRLRQRHPQLCARCQRRCCRTPRRRREQRAHSSRPRTAPSAAANCSDSLTRDPARSGDFSPPELPPWSRLRSQPGQCVSPFRPFSWSG